jgi:periplasmic divalent cation tolerance protein
MIYSTFASHEQAEYISRALLEAKLVACANIFPAHQSLYHWDGAIQNESEVAVIYKSTNDQFESVRAMIVNHHTYDVPCVVTFDISKGHEPYLNWIKNTVNTEAVK